MRLLALCIGVNAQDDLDIPILPFAGDDAAALWALAADWGEAAGTGTFEEDDCILLTGADTTRANILSALEAMAARSRAADYDLALVHFAGHGHPAGYLLGVDALAEHPATGVSLAEFTDAARRIRAGHAVIAFDACFSGRASLLAGAGAAPDAPRGSAAEIAAQLHQLADERRAVLWACGADERAWESSRLEHGLLSYGLVSALEQPERLERGRDLSLMAWIEQAYRTVAVEAATDGRTQTPGRLVFWQGVSALPRPVLGPRRQRQLAEREIVAVSGDVRTLDVYGFAPQVLDALDARLRGSPLSGMQQRAIAPGGLLAGRSLVVSAPTSTGKTLIGELAALGCAARGRRAMFLMPTRALVEEKFEEFAATFGPAGVSAVRSYGGVDDDDAALMALQFDVAFLTYEKCLGLCLQRTGVLDALGVVVLDEVHLLGEKERGPAVELLLGMLRARRAVGQRIQVVALSAALGDLGGLHEWLDATAVTPDPRPIPLRSGVVDPSGRFRYRHDENGEVTFGHAQLFAPETLVPAPPAGADAWRADIEQTRREQVAATIVRERLSDTAARLLVFRARKPDTRQLAQRLATQCRLDPSPTALAELTPAGSARDDSRASAQLAQCLRLGVGFHLADLDRRERLAVEAGVRSGEIRVTVATSTLAAGVNTPATDVVLVDSMRYDSDAGGDAPYEVGEVRNTLGRAGRWLPGVPAGTGYVAASSRAEADQLFNDYFIGDPPALTSRLGRTARVDLVLALLGARLATSRESVTDAVLDTFDGHQHAADAAWRQQQRVAVREAVDTLVADGFVIETNPAAPLSEHQGATVAADAPSSLALTPLGAVCARESLAAASARRVLGGALAIRAANEPLDEVALVALTQITDELDRFYTSVSRNDYGIWFGPLSQLLPGRDATRAVLHDDDLRRYTCRQKRLFALLQWTRGLPLGQIEAQFGAKFDATQTFAGMIRGIGERTAQVARGVAAVLLVVHPTEAAGLRAASVQLRPRLEHGLTRTSANLARARLGLSRAEIHALAGAGCTTAEALAAALATRWNEMAAIFGSSRAAELRTRLDVRSLERLQRRQRREEAVQQELFANLTSITEF